ncbi:MAG: DapH/DapD/GlmU-related protein [Candidatus Alcyoniella australis]|nr:DapH/DapD/GlmU-related protein [Candidatus Alcyoniella australis]
MKDGKPQAIGENVSIGTGCVFGRNVIIGDNVELGERCIIGDNVELRECRLGGGVRVERNALVGYSTLTGWFSTGRREVEDDPGIAELGEDCLVRTDAVIYRGARIGASCWINHKALVRERSRIGHHTSVGSMVDVEGYCSIGNYCSINSQAYVAAKSSLGDYVFMGPQSVTTNDNPIGYRRDLPDPMQGPKIGFGVSIGARAVILPRVLLGMEVVIGAGAVVTSDVPDGMLAYGVPARVMGPVPEDWHLPREVRQSYGRG